MTRILLFLPWWCLTAIPASAKDLPTLLVVGLHDAGLDAAAQRTASERCIEVIEADKRFAALGPDDLARAVAGREDLILANAWLTSGRRLLEDGRILHDQAQPEDAIPVLEQATLALAEAMVAADATRELWEAYLYLGASRYAIKKTKESKEATAAWQAAVALAPERLPDQARVAPQIVQAFRAVQDAARAKPARLVVTVDGDATVQLNDRAPVPAPATFENLVPGTVFVRAKASDGRIAFRAVTVAPPTTAPQQAALVLAEPTLPAGGATSFGRARAMSELYRGLGQQAKPTLLLVAGGSSGNATLQFYAPASDAFSKPLDVPCEGTCDDEIAAALPKLLSSLSDDGALPASATTPTAAALETSSNSLLARLLLDPQPVAPVVERRLKWWQIGAGGAGAVVVGATVTAAAILGGGDGNRGTIIVGPVP
jgi:tetratricopeptide (TPR) repeat protein